jgi:hypothetical protein
MDTINHHLSFRTCVTLLLFFFSAALHAQETITFSSPDGKTQGEIILADGKLSWKMDYHAKPVVLSSALGIGRFTDGLRLKGS